MKFGLLIKKLTSEEERRYPIWNWK